MIKDIDNVIKLIAEAGFNNEEIYKKLMNGKAGNYDDFYYKKNNLVNGSLNNLIKKLNIKTFGCKIFGFKTGSKCVFFKSSFDKNIDNILEYLYPLMVKINPRLKIEDLTEIRMNIYRSIENDKIKISLYGIKTNGRETNMFFIDHTYVKKLQELGFSFLDASYILDNNDFYITIKAKNGKMQGFDLTVSNYSYCNYLCQLERDKINLMTKKIVNKVRGSFLKNGLVATEINDVYFNPYSLKESYCEDFFSFISFDKYVYKSVINVDNVNIANVECVGVEPIKNKNHYMIDLYVDPYNNENIILRIFQVNKITYHPKNRNISLVKSDSIKLNYSVTNKTLMLYDDRGGWSKLSAITPSFKDLIIILLNGFDQSMAINIFDFICAITPDENHYLLRDIKEEFINKELWLPTKVEKLMTGIYKNKKDFLFKCYGYDGPNRVNKESLTKSMLMAKADRYIPKNKTQLFWEQNINMDFDYTRINYAKRKEIARKLWQNLILLNIIEKEKSIEKDEIWDLKCTINDYCNMFLELHDFSEIKTNINTWKSLKKNHDKVLEDVRERNYQKIMNDKKNILKEPENSKFKNLKLPEKYKKIDKKEDLYLLGEKQHNCVFTYLKAINKGDCVIYTCYHKNEQYTICIRKKNDKFTLSQIKGKFNSPAPDDLKSEIKNLLKENNKKTKRS